MTDPDPVPAPDPATAKSDPLSSCAEIAVIAFGSWTLYCNTLVYTGQDFETLMRFSFLPLLATGLLVWLRPRSERLHLRPSARLRLSPSAPLPSASEAAPGAGLPIVLAVVVAATASHVAGFYLGYWLGALAALAFICVAGARPPAALVASMQRARTLRYERAQMAAVLCLALLAAVMTSVAHRADGDDSVYVSMIVTAMDFPNAPLLRFDGIHGVPELPLTFTNYRAHSYELLNAALASLVGAEPLQVYHLLMPPLMAIGVVLSGWLLLRQLSPRLALAGLAFSMLALAAWGDSYRSPGNLAFVRLFQGKAIFATALIPLILFFALRFARQRDLRSWTALCAAQVAAMGLTATALAVAPVAAGLALLASARADRASLRMLLAGAAASIHALVVGAIVAYESTGATGLAVASHPDVFGILYQDIDVQRDLAAVFGVKPRAWIALACLPIVPFFVAGRTQRRVIALLLLFFYALVLNPWTSSWLIRLLAERGSTLLTWRFLWILPAPLLLGLCVAGLCRSIPMAGTPLRRTLCLAVAAVVYLSLPGTRALSRENGVRFSTPGYKVGSTWPIAARIQELTPDRARVLAPENVAQWLPTLREHPYPEVARILYIAALESSFGPDEVATRIKLHRFISGKKGRRMPIEELRALLRKRRIATVVFSQRLDEAKPLAEMLRGVGYEGEGLGGYQLWSLAR